MFREGKMIRKNSMRLNEKGQNFVEIALTLPIIIVLFFGMIEIGLATHSFVIVASSAREGARFGARGVHVPMGDIISIIETSMSKGIATDYFGPDANTTIIVTQIDLDEDGTYSIYDKHVHGDLSVTSTICEPADKPCWIDRLDLQDFIDANNTFNANPELCKSSFGCKGDFVVVEIFHLQDTSIVSGLVRDFIPYPFPINSTAVMKVLHLRASS